MNIEHWFEASGFGYTINTWPSLELLLDSLLLYCGWHRDLAALDLQIWPFHMLQHFIDEVDIEAGHSPSSGLESSWIGQPDCFPLTTRTAGAPAIFYLAHTIH